VPALFGVGVVLTGCARGQDDRAVTTVAAGEPGAWRGAGVRAAVGAGRGRPTATARSWSWRASVGGCRRPAACRSREIRPAGVRSRR